MTAPDERLDEPAAPPTPSGGTVWLTGPPSAGRTTPGGLTPSALVERGLA